jgi:hypothetical protein
MTNPIELGISYDVEVQMMGNSSFYTNKHSMINKVT